MTEEQRRLLLFSKFLADNGASIHKFIEEAEHSQSNGNTVKQLTEKIFRDLRDQSFNIINSRLIWNRTYMGRTFWETLDSEWRHESGKLGIKGAIV